MSGWSNATIQLVTLELYVPQQIAMTDPVPRQRDLKDYRAELPELNQLNLEPFLFLTLYPERKRNPAKIEVFTCPLVNPERPGLYMKVKPAKIGARIIRQAPRHPITLKLGAQRDIAEFQYIKSAPLIRYTQNEELQWRVEVTIQYFEW